MVEVPHVKAPDTVNGVPEPIRWYVRLPASKVVSVAMLRTLFTVISPVAPVWVVMVGVPDDAEKVRV